MSEQTKTSKRTISLLLAALVVALLATAATAYALIAAGLPVSDDNFKVSVNEPPATSYRVMPGATQPIDSTISVNVNRAAYLFAALVDGTNGKVKYAVDEGWTPLKDDNGMQAVHTEGGVSAPVYYREVTQGSSTLTLLKEGQITFPASLSNEDLEALNSADANTIEDGDPSASASADGAVSPNAVRIWTQVTQQEGFTGPLAALNGYYGTGSFSVALPNTDKYLYRVGNKNAVKLGSLFSYTDTADPATAVSGNDIEVEVKRLDDETSVAKESYTSNADWAKSTLQFTGEGPVRVTLSGIGKPCELLLEVIDGWNVTDASGLNHSGTSNILLRDVSITGGMVYLTGTNLYGNGFTLDVTKGSTNLHGIVQIQNAVLDNVKVVGPVFKSYVANYRSDGYASVIDAQDGAIISNSYISGASSPVRVRGNALVENTILSGGVLANSEIRSGHCTFTDVTTIGDSILGVVINIESDEVAANTSITLQGEFIQHNVIANDPPLENMFAKALQAEMFSSEYSAYHFSFDNDEKKYVNPGILSLSDKVGESSIIDLREDKACYQGKPISVSVLLVGTRNGYVYTMTNEGYLDIAYAEPDPVFSPSVNRLYEPGFTWSLGEQEIQPGGDIHCYKDSAGKLQIQFVVKNKFDLDVSTLATVKKYSSRPLTTRVLCEDAYGAELPVDDGHVVFDTAGEYSIIYSFADPYAYDEDGTNVDPAPRYERVIDVNVAIKKSNLKGKISVSSPTGTILWGKTGTPYDPDYKPCAPVLNGVSIVDYDDDGEEYTVLDGNNQSDFIEKIVAMKLNSDSKTGFTLQLRDGTSLYISNGAPYNNGTILVRQFDKTLYLCGTKNVNELTGPKAISELTWSIISYSYTGRNGEAVSYATRRTFTGKPSDKVESYDNFKDIVSSYTLTLDVQGGEQLPVSSVQVSPYELPSASRPGYQFGGWYTTADGSGTPYKAGESFTFKKNTTLYAHWYIPHSVKFDANGGVCDQGEAMYEGTPLTLPTATRGNLSFVGWYTSADEGDLIGDAGESYVPESDITLYAHWTSNPKVSFDANGGSCDETSRIYDGSTDLELPAATREGYNFEGWYTEAEGGDLIGAAGASYAPTATTTLYAHWSAQTFTVTIKAGDNGRVSPTTISDVPYGTQVTVSSSKLTIGNETVTATPSSSSYTFDSWDIKTGTEIKGDRTITASFKSSSTSCIAAGTPITLADGTRKPVEELTAGEQLLVWDLQSGSYSQAPAVFIDSEPSQQFEVITLQFSDNTCVDVIGEHGFFDVDLARYVYLDHDAIDYLGHRFVREADISSNAYEVVTLCGVDVHQEMTTAWSPVTYGHLCYFVNGMLSMPGGIEGLFNIFEVDASTMRYKPIPMLSDIIKYGLFSYEEFSDLVSEEAFGAFNGAYLKVAMGKGLLDWDDVRYLAQRYMPLMATSTTNE